MKKVDCAAQTLIQTLSAVSIQYYKNKLCPKPNVCRVYPDLFVLPIYVSPYDVAALSLSPIFACSSNIHNLLKMKRQKNYTNKSLCEDLHNISVAVRHCRY